MRTDRIDETLEVCQIHLDSLGYFNARIDNLLACSGLIIIYSEFEKTVEDILLEKGAMIDDSSIRNFAESYLRTLNRRISSGALCEILKKFGEKYESDFRDKLKESVERERSETAYNNIVTNRNNAAHSTGSNVSFGDVKSFFEQGHIVLDLFRETLLQTD